MGRPDKLAADIAKQTFGFGANRADGAVGADHDQRRRAATSRKAWKTAPPSGRLRSVDVDCGGDQADDRARLVTQRRDHEVEW